MQTLDTLSAAGSAVSTRADRPATAVLADGPDARLVVFRLAPGQEVAPHRSTSTVILTVIRGPGEILGPDGARTLDAGSVALFAPEELHGMRATGTELIVLATIAPRPGSR